MSSRYRYRAFISYSHTDERAVSRLHSSLESYVIPQSVVAAHDLKSNRLRPIFRDRDELAAASSLSAALQEALDSSEHLIVACSPQTAESRWVNEEVRYFLEHHPRGSVLAVIVGGERFEFPEALRYELDDSGVPDLAQPLEPMAADMREVGDGLEAAKLKLAAAMVGVRYDDLARREQVERNRRLRRVAALSTVGMIVAGLLAAYAFVQRDIAIEQRAIAERESATANRVVDFLTDTFRVADPATENPQEITAINVLDRGAERLRSELEEEPVVRARLMATVGDVYENLGLFEPAEEMFETSLAIDRSDEGRIAERLVALAEIKLRKAEIDQIEPILQEALLEMSADPDRRLLAQIESIRGRTALIHARLDDALRHLSTAVKGYTATNGEDDLTTAREKSRLATVYAERGNFDAALPLLTEAIAVFTHHHGEVHSTTAGLNLNRGNLNVQMQRFEDAAEDLDRVLPVLHEIYGETHPVLATAYLNKGMAALGLRDASAHAALVRAKDIGVQYFGEDHGFVVLVLFNLAVAQARAGEGDDAHRSLDQVARILAAIYPPDHPQVPFVTTQRGVVFGELGDEDNARSHCKDGVAALEQLTTAGPEYVALAKAECGLWLDNGAAAQNG